MAALADHPHQAAVVVLDPDPGHLAAAQPRVQHQPADRLRPGVREPGEQLDDLLGRARPGDRPRLADLRQIPAEVRDAMLLVRPAEEVADLADVVTPGAGAEV